MTIIEFHGERCHYRIGILTCMYMTPQMPPIRLVCFQRNRPNSIRERSTISVMNDERITILLSTIWSIVQKFKNVIGRVMAMADYMHQHSAGPGGPLSGLGRDRNIL
jgi:hypothetical protein